MRELALSMEGPNHNKEQGSPVLCQGGRAKSCLPDLLSLIKDKMSAHSFFFSVELVPSSNSKLHSLLMESLQVLKVSPPLFATVTWHSQYLVITKDKASGEITKVHHPAFEVVKILQNSIGIPAVMHFSVGMLNKVEVHAILVAAHAIGVKNILALRGDLESHSEQRDFSNASNLVKYIRREFGDTFTIAVAGYPLGHPEAASYKEDLSRLKDKIDCGGDIIFTQMILSSEEFYLFVQECQQLDINVPIIPGIHIIETINLLRRMVILCKLPAPLKILSRMEELNGDEDKEIQFGLEETGSILKSLHQSRCCPGVNYFTLNRIKPVFKLLNILKFS